MDQHLEQIFNKVKGKGETVDTTLFMSQFSNYGILADDPRMKGLRNKVEELQDTVISKSKFFELIHKDASEIEQMLFNPKVIPNFQAFKQSVRAIYQECLQNNKGQLPDYIPELANADKSKFGVSICSIDGQRFSLG